MRRATLAATLLLSLLTLLVVDSRHLSATTRATLQRDTAPIRALLIDRLRDPDTAALVFAAGAMLIFLECNRPGAILPGACGLLLALSGAYGLALHPVRAAGLASLFVAVIGLLLAGRTSHPTSLGFASGCALCYGLWRLILPTDAYAPVHLSVAILVGAVIGASATWLGRIAEQARRNKAILSSAASRPAG